MADLEALLAQSREKLAAMAPEDREAMWRAQRESWVRGEMALGLDHHTTAIPAKAGTQT